MRRLAGNTFITAVLAALVLVLPGAARADDAVSEELLQPPSELFGDFFEKVAMSGLFLDSKQWADAIPKHPPQEILGRTAGLDFDSPEALGDFLTRHFELNPATPAAIEPEKGLPLCEHIAALWPLLTRESAEQDPWSSRLALPHPYVVPGGRFREVYYWDSYFTMLGFGAEQADLRRNMVMNFAHQIRRYGHIPNGNRTYYLSRSQPPFFYRMVALLAPERPATAWAEFLPELRAEHAFWMQDAAQSTPEQAARRVVTMPDGSLLNRYWDARDVPRDESFREDVEAAEAAGDVDRSTSLSRLPRGGGKRLGFQLPLVRRRRVHRDHANDVHCPRRPQQPVVRTRAGHRRRLPRERRQRLRPPLRHAGGGPARGDAPLPVERGDRRL